ncbi:hypothetical protein J2S92_003698 [Arthrobacter bambusae]|nr:hypothetical protein [Arthrobacter bambusae]MDQ0237302.1 hypothetical protein [Arthrobacter bambusae]
MCSHHIHGAFPLIALGVIRQYFLTWCERPQCRLLGSCLDVLFLLYYYSACRVLRGCLIENEDG